MLTLLLIHLLYLTNRVNTEMISIQLSLENSYNVEVFKRDDDGIYPVEIYFSDVVCLHYKYVLFKG